jgi:hypothetical protein
MGVCGVALRIAANFTASETWAAMLRFMQTAGAHVEPICHHDVMIAG